MLGTPGKRRNRYGICAELKVNARTLDKEKFAVISFLSRETE